jgi:hypothetical protein
MDKENHNHSIQEFGAHHVIPLIYFSLLPILNYLLRSIMTNFTF